MTLGGLALAVGILVDDATVAIENIHRNLEQGKLRCERLIVDGAQQIAIPAFVSTLSICIVFLPIFALTGTAGALFRPLAMAVVFAMAASYFFSRTLVPTMTDYMLPGEAAEHAARDPERPSTFRRIVATFDRVFEGFRGAYHSTHLAWAMLHRRAVLATASGVCAGVPAARSSHPGRDFFPQVDGGQFRNSTCALPPVCGSSKRNCSLREWSSQCDGVIPAHDLQLVLDTSGSPRTEPISRSDRTPALAPPTAT